MKGKVNKMFDIVGRGACTEKGKAELVKFLRDFADTVEKMPYQKITRVDIEHVTHTVPVENWGLVTPMYNGQSLKLEIDMN